LVVVTPTKPGYGAIVIDAPQRGRYSTFFSRIGGCDNLNFHDARLAAAQLNI
jgi:hypothetical protein